MVEPGNGPDFEGEGTLSLISKGIGKLNVQGLNIEKELSIPSEEHFKIYVTGPLVRMALDIPQGTIYFDGFIRGEEEQIGCIRALPARHATLMSQAFLSPLQPRTPQPL